MGVDSTGSQTSCPSLPSPAYSFIHFCSCTRIRQVFRHLLCARKSTAFDPELPHPDSCPQIALGGVILIFAKLSETNQQEQR